MIKLNFDLDNKIVNTETLNNKFELIPCAVCSSLTFCEFLAIPYGALKQKASLDYTPLGISPDTVLSVKKCAVCGFVLVNPRVKTEYEELVYVQSKKNIQKKDSNQKIKDVQRIPLRRALSYFNENPEELVFFDYGCGFGQSLQIANDLGMKTYGIDVDERRVTACRERGFSVTHPREFNKQFPEVKANILFLQSIIEHVIDVPAFTIEVRDMEKAEASLLYMQQQGYLK